MTRRRWIADEVSGNRAALVGEHARHLSLVVRARVGQEFDISTGTEVRRARVSSILPHRVEFDLGEIITPVPDFPITVAISVFKFDRMEWAIEKSTELGVARIVPVIAARTASHLATAAAKRVARWKRIAQQAAEQSRRLSPPEIAHPIKFNELLAMTANARIVLSEMEDRLMLKDAIPRSASSLLLAFGPEGGWQVDELAAFGENRWTSASLGNTILRAETAVIAAIAVVNAMI
jgi:16S rRNA (uracil1498-N3)-methyltransferase